MPGGGGSGRGGARKPCKGPGAAVGESEGAADSRVRGC